MIKELAAQTGHGTLVVVVMLIAIALFGLLVYGLVKKPDAEAEAEARLPLDDGEVVTGADAGNAREGGGDDADASPDDRPQDEDTP